MFLVIQMCCFVFLEIQKLYASCSKKTVQE